MRHVNVHQAKTTLSALIRAVTEGEEIVITNHGKPVARLVAPERPKSRRLHGALRQVPGRVPMTREQIDAALAPMSEAELEAEGWE